MLSVGAERLGQAYRHACELDVQALKPGNVGIHAEGHRMSVADFRRSAQVSVGPLVDRQLGLGERIFRAVENTWGAVGSNTNLGIVLLCAPLLYAMQIDGSGPLQKRLSAVLAGTTVTDAEWTYRAIRLANPAGLGRAESGDIAQAPNMTLTDAMRLAVERDRIAYLYSTDYSDIFDLTIPRYHVALEKWQSEIWACTSVFVSLLSLFPDSHLQRKYANRFTTLVKERMAGLESELWCANKPEDVIPQFIELDAEFKAVGVNPGTTADIVVATALCVQLERLLTG